MKDSHPLQIALAILALLGIGIGIGAVITIVVLNSPLKPKEVSIGPVSYEIPTPFTLNQTTVPNQATTPKPTSTREAIDENCFPQTNWTPPKPTANGEWIYDCLSSGPGNWVGQSEEWKAANWKRGSGQSEIVNVVVPKGAKTMGIGCNPCTIIAPNGTTLSPQCLTESECFGPFRPNAVLNVTPGEVYKVQIFGGDSCPTRKGVAPPCAPEIYIWFNLP